jgi:predicted acyltransferase
VAGGVHVSATVNAGQTNGKAVASLVCGIGGLVVVPIVLPIAALVLGYQARRELRERPAQGGAGLATAGVVLGWIGVVWGVFLVFFAVVLALGTMSHSGG